MVIEGDQQRQGHGNSPVSNRSHESERFIVRRYALSGRTDRDDLQNKDGVDGTART